jgi:selenocysteine-specific elongation factor
MTAAPTGSFVVGTAGHIDHGKSALVKALTQIDPDRLEEEKRRGMTIDLGFAYLELPSGRRVGMVDVPGHQRFLKNMLAGVHGMDAVLLVIAADEGPMPQTREHLAIVDLLRIEHGLVVLSKADLVDDAWLALIRDDVAGLLAGTSLRRAPIVAASSVTGKGLEELRAALDAELAITVPRPDIGRPRLPVDRSFAMSGFGTVVTGTLVGGVLRQGAEVALLPACSSTIDRSKKPSQEAGQR